MNISTISEIDYQILYSLFVLLLSTLVYNIWLKENGKFSFSLFFVSCFVIFCSIVGLSIAVSYVSIPDNDYLQFMDELYTQPWKAFLLTVLFAPLTEELIFRGILLKGLKKFVQSSWVIYLIVFFQAVLFGLIHEAHWLQQIHTFIIGMCLGVMVVKTKQIRGAIILHMLNNMIPFLLTYLY
jgi:membrane protease YdiL (CAAX protease family)